MVIVGIIIAVFFLFILLPAFVAYKLTFSKRDGKYHTSNSDIIPYDRDIKESLSFLKKIQCTEEKITADNNTVLYADYYNRNSKHTVIMAHGYSVLPMDNFCCAAEDLYKDGYNVLLIYERAHGKSTGKCSTLGLKESEDLIKWTEYIYSKYKTDIAVYGISMGCVAAAYSSDKFNSNYVKAVILDCGFESPYSQIKYECDVRHMPGSPLLPFIRLFAKAELNIDIKLSVRDSLRKTDIPALFIYGEKDKTIPVETGRKNYDSCKSEKEFVIVLNAPHAMSYIVDRKVMRKKIEDFLSRNME